MPNTQKVRITIPEDIQLNENEAIQNILGNPPNWLLRWGITVVAFSVLGVLAMSWLIKYPDIIEAPIILTTEHPPIEVVARSNGNIQTLSIANETYIEKGQLLVELEHNATLSDIYELEVFLQKIITHNTYTPLPSFPKRLDVGKLQNSYSTLSQDYKSLRYFIKKDITTQQIAALQYQIEQTQLLNQSHIKQNEIYKQEVGYAEIHYKRQQALHEDGTISTVELENTAVSYLQHKRQLENLNTTIINNNLQIEQKKQQILELQSQKSNTLHEQYLVLRENAKRLLHEIQSWKQQYLVLAPIEGTVAFKEALSEQQYIAANDVLMTIIPNTFDNNIIGEAILPANGIGKVQKGLSTQIQLDNFPYQEYGTLAASVYEVALIPEDTEMGKVYRTTFELSDTLRTNYQKIIPFNQDMSGKARIITEDKRLAVRIFEKLWSMVV